MRSIARQYIRSFEGLSPEVWWLSLVTLINRAGTMVIPFLSLYLSESLSFDLESIGWVMSAFGLGSLIGSWLGGKLTDRLGYYKVMYTSLLLSGVGFIILQYLQTFSSLCLGIFVIMLVADAFRPAVFVALTAYSKEENRTRSVSLIRLAINLGFSAGPALGGLIITHLDYAGLFWVDGITCMAAGVLMLVLLDPKRVKTETPSVINTENISPYRDRSYLLFIAATFLFGLVFLQYFSTVPLFYKDIHGLSEGAIGLILAMNGFLIFLLEMPLIKYLENRSVSTMGYILFGILLTMLSFLVLNLGSWSGLLIIGMLLMTLGEMVAFPFSNALALKMAQKGKQGAYMALYTIAFSFGHLFGHNSGMQLASWKGYAFTWWIMILTGGISMLMLFLLRPILRKERISC
ncbi:MFS transporter [Robertkochia marina]|uniref:MFS transporter n=1 Tax=Robertkochia marina TaxID=1227945 RepID=A0A4S3M1L9_9FLAO|nr:MFS transporter [Robertkochia marina]THD67345.1 MFS transporter [Robertkochia marina]TRZ43002.1 MFS transporter [Robertkochia marina]